jgi:hypothetical protein
MDHFVAAGPLLCHRAAPIGGVVVGNDDFPGLVTYLFGKSPKLLLQPRMPLRTGTTTLITAES